MIIIYFLVEELFLVRRIISLYNVDFVSFLESVNLNDYGEEENEGFGFEFDKGVEEEMVDVVMKRDICFIFY